MAVHVDAQTDILVLTSGVLNYNAAYGIGGWYYMEADRDTFSYFMAVSADGNNYDALGTTINGTTFRAELGVAGSFPVDTSTTDLSVGSWYFVAMERISTTSFNGYLFDATGALLDTVSLTNNVTGRSAADRITLGGNIDNVSFWINARLAGFKGFTSAIGVDGWRTEMWEYMPKRGPYAIWPLLVGGLTYEDYGPSGLALGNSGAIAGTAVGPPIAWRRGRSRTIMPTAAVETGHGLLLSSHRNRLVRAA